MFPVPALLPANARGFVRASGVMLAYVVAYVILYPHVGHRATILFLVPVTLIGRACGFWGGLLAGVGGLPLNLFLNALAKPEVTGWEGPLLQDGGFSALMPMLFGAMIGRMRDMGREILGERDERAKVEVIWSDCREAMEHAARHDPLTGLPNRLLLRERLVGCIADDGSGSGRLALLVIALGRYKEIANALSGGISDEVLLEACSRMRAPLGPADTVAHLADGEFAVLLPGASEKEALGVAKRIHVSLGHPFASGGLGLDVAASVGIALAPEHGPDAATLLQRAELASEVAGRDRRGPAVYSADRDRICPHRLTLIGQLRRGIEGDQLLLHYQPKLDLRTTRVTGVEALIRWQHPQEGLLQPGRFIPLAESVGLIEPLTLWSLKVALFQCRDWHRAGLRLGVAVNLSAICLQDPHLVAVIVGMLEAADVLPGWLTVEVTEGALMADLDKAAKMLARLRNQGVRVSIDDFGTGFSSLSYLRKLPVDELKVDRSFVSGMVIDRRAAAIVRSIIELGHGLGLRVVAEGVEEQEALGMLRMLACDQVQGYALSRPMPATEVADWAACWHADRSSSGSSERPSNIRLPSDSMTIPSVC